jgi:putative flippase GtrA
MSVVECLKTRLTLGRFGRFALVGVLGTGLDMGLLLLLTAAAGLSTLPSNMISYSAGIINNYYWNRRWTFTGGQHTYWPRQLTQFAVVSLVGLGLNSLIVVWMEGLIGLLSAKLLATGLVLLWNYNANRLWTFGEPASVEVVEW